MSLASTFGVMNQQDILQVMNSKGGFKTLVAALRAVGLSETLKNSGPFTLFAPSDEAFKKLPDGTLDGWLKPENKAELAGILAHHVLIGTLETADLMGKAFTRKSVAGAELSIDGTRGVTVNNIKVVKPDIPATNGIIHVIDSVLIPPKA